MGLGLSARITMDRGPLVESQPEVLYQLHSMSYCMGDAAGRYRPQEGAIMRIIGYTIVEETSRRDCENEVARKIGEGYQPLGGCEALVDPLNGHMIVYHQTMVRTAPDAAS